MDVFFFGGGGHWLSSIDPAPGIMVANNYIITLNGCRSCSACNMKILSLGSLEEKGEDRKQKVRTGNRTQHQPIQVWKNFLRTPPPPTPVLWATQSISWTPCKFFLDSPEVQFLPNTVTLSHLLFVVHRTPADPTFFFFLKASQKTKFQTSLFLGAGVYVTFFSPQVLQQNWIFQFTYVPPSCRTTYTTSNWTTGSILTSLALFLRPRGMA